MGPIANEAVYSYVGNGAPVLMRRALGPEANEEDVNRALEFFIRYYGEHCLDNTSLYPGVKEALDRFHAHGFAMAVLTNKPVRISNHIVRELGLGPHFFRVYGGNSFDRKKPDPIGIETLLTESGLPRENAFMIGDSGVDVRTARNAGIRACGVSYGFQPEGFESDLPDLLVDSMGEFADRLLSRD
jgi:phosphoglycolate phosphatase